MTNEVARKEWRERFCEGVRLHDEGAWFEAHEAWEGLWRESRDPEERRLLQGLIQATAAFHKLFVMKDPKSAERLLARGLAKLDGMPAAIADVDLTKFREALRGCIDPIRNGALAPLGVPRLRPRDE